MESLLQNPWWSGLIILITQLFFVFFRTLNVIYNARKQLIPTIITGNIIGICWLVTLAFGVTAIINLQWQPIIAHLLGGTVGVIFGFKAENKLKNKIK